MNIDLALHSYSLRHHFAHKPGFDAIAFADLAFELGFSGINLSLNDANYRHLGGREPERMDRLREHLTGLGFSLEIDTSGTDPAHMTEMLEVAHRMGATSLRTYTRHRGTIREMMERTQRDLAECVALAELLGVTVVLENHEDFIGPELAEIVSGIDHPNLRILYDYGNSQMVLEDPETALGAVLPYVHSVHVKDHVLIRSEPEGELLVAGVPVGEGFLPIERLTRRLLESGLRRFAFENVWGYSAPIHSGRLAQPDVTVGEASFQLLKQPFRPDHLLQRPETHSVADVLDWEYSALIRGLASFHRTLTCHGTNVNGRNIKVGP